MKNGELTDQERRALRRAKRLAVSLDGYRGVDFGYAYKEGESTKQTAIRFHLERKMIPSDIHPAQLIPKEILGVPCDVIEASYRLHQGGNPRIEHDPVVPGISVGNLPHDSSGTLGLLVRDRQSGNECILSNWHVLCASTASQAGEDIIQPSRNNLGSTLARTIAKLSRWTEIENGYDAAIAELSDGIQGKQEPFGLDLRIQSLGKPVEGMLLVKSGAASDQTRAMVDSVEGSFLMDYGAFGGERLNMSGIRIVPDPNDPVDEVSVKGDSGSVWLEVDTGNAIALNFGGEDNLTAQYEFALAHPISKVLNLLDVELIT